MHPGVARDAAQRVARAVGQAVKGSGGALRLLGPAPAPIARIRGRCRWQMLVKGPTSRSLVPAAEAAEAAARLLTGDERASLDVDPLAML